MALPIPDFQWLNKTGVDVAFNNVGSNTPFTDHKGNLNYDAPNGVDQGLQLKTGSLFTSGNTSGVTKLTMGFMFKTNALSDNGWIMSQWSNSNNELNTGVRVDTAGSLHFTKAISPAGSRGVRTVRADLEDNVLRNGLVTWNKTGDTFKIYIDGSPESLIQEGSGSSDWANFLGTDWWMNGRRDFQAGHSIMHSFRWKVWLGTEATDSEALIEATSELAVIEDDLERRNFLTRGRRV